MLSASADGFHRVCRSQLPQLLGHFRPILGETVGVGERAGGTGGIAALTVHLRQMQPGGGPGWRQGQRIDQQPFRFLQAAQPQISQPELSGGLRIGGISDESLAEYRQRFPGLIAVQIVQSLLEQGPGLDCVAPFRPAQIIQLFAEGLHSGFVVGG
jgi:hypothetical protein